MDIIILGFLIFLNGLFSMSEIALVSARKARLESQAERGDKKAKTGAGNVEPPGNFSFLRTDRHHTDIASLPGFIPVRSSAGTCNRWSREWSFSGLMRMPSPPHIIVIVVTFLSIIFGELIPKRIGLLRSEKIAKTVAGPIRVFLQAVSSHRMAAE